MSNEMPKMKATTARLRTTRSVGSTDPSALQSEMLLVIGRVKRRMFPSRYPQNCSGQAEQQQT